MSFEANQQEDNGFKNFKCASIFQTHKIIKIYSY
jgi:hypothetical protein